MQHKPRSASESLFTRRFTVRLCWQGAMVGLLTLAAYAIGLYGFDNLPAANTMAFATLTISQLFHAFDVRSEEQSIFRLGITSNPAMNKAFVVGMVLQLVVLLVPPVMSVFEVVYLNAWEYVAVLILSLLPMVISEVVKAVRRSPKQ